jgi:hypothetical protein
VFTINPHIPAEYWWLTFATLPMWACALWWNIAATRTGVFEGMKIRAATAALALVYLAGNCVLLFSHVNPARWSDVMRGFMLLSIPIVWTAPARLSVRMAHRIREADARVVEREQRL